MARRFRGQEEVRIDGKGRMSIPAKFRRVFEAGDPDWNPGERPKLVIVYGLPDWHHLEFYTMEAIDEIDDAIDRMPRGSLERRALERLMHGASEEAEIDQEGRLVLPQKLREKIGLQDSALFVASGDYLKVWSPEGHAAAEQDIDAFFAGLEPGFDPRALLPQPEREE